MTGVLRWERDMGQPSEYVAMYLPQAGVAMRAEIPRVNESDFAYSVQNNKVAALLWLRRHD